MLIFFGKHLIARSVEKRYLRTQISLWAKWPASFAPVFS
jgi:hypothetical protein